jgi:hypothetical protein
VSINSEEVQSLAFGWRFAFLLYTAFSGIKRYLDIRREDRRLEKLIQENRERSGPD